MQLTELLRQEVAMAGYTEILTWYGRPCQRLAAVLCRSYPAAAGNTAMLVLTVDLCPYMTCYMTARNMMYDVIYCMT